MRLCGLAVGIWLVAAAPAWAAAPDSATVKFRPVALRRAEFGLAEGVVWGRVGAGGLFCRMTRKDLKWNLGQAQLHANRLAAPFKDALAEAGLASGDLFDKAGSRERLQVGAVIEGLTADICRDDPQGRSRKPIDAGSLTMTVAWQVFDPVRGETVLRIETRGDAKQPKAERDGLDHMFARAFLDSARRLAADSRFRDLILISAASPAAPPAVPPTAARTLAEGPEPVLAVRRAVVRISTGKRRGTGVLVAADGAVLTTRSTVGAAQFVTLTWSDGREAVGEVTRTDLKRNLALVRADPHGVAPPNLRRGKVPVGEQAFAVNSEGDASSVRSGAIAALRNLDGASYLETPIAVAAEDSGEPLVDAKGAVIGLSIGGSEPGALPEGVGLFIRAGDALDLLRAKSPSKPRRPHR